MLLTLGGAWVTSQTKGKTEAPDGEKYTKAIHIAVTGITLAPSCSQAWDRVSQVSAWWQVGAARTSDVVLMTQSLFSDFGHGDMECHLTGGKG